MPFVSCLLCVRASVLGVRNVLIAVKTKHPIPMPPTSCPSVLQLKAEQWMGACGVAVALIPTAPPLKAALRPPAQDGSWQRSLTSAALALTAHPLTAGPLLSARHQAVQQGESRGGDRPGGKGVPAPRAGS